jgi:ABC-type phosphate transport system auxiliary subunit
MKKYYSWSVGGPVMTLELSIIIVCGLLNLIPWLLLAYFRPDLDINEQIKQTDQGLAMVAQVLMERLESLEDLAGSAMQGVPENPFAALISSFMQQKLAGTEVYGRQDDGTFDGTKEIIETTSTQNHSD